MTIEFPVLIGLNGGHGECGDSVVTIDLTDEEYERLRAAAKQSDWERLDDVEDIKDIEQKASEAFRDDQIGFIDDDFLEEIAEDNEVDKNDLTEEQIWDAFCDRYSFCICFPEDLLEEEDEEYGE